MARKSGNEESFGNGMDEFEQRLAQADAPELTQWEPQPGDVLIGEVVNAGSFDTRFGESRYLHVRDASTGEVITVWLKTVLRKAIDDEQVGLGDVIGIKYIGKKSRAHLYAMLVKSRAEESKALPF